MLKRLRLSDSFQAQTTLDYRLDRLSVGRSLQAGFVTGVVKKSLTKRRRLSASVQLVSQMESDRIGMTRSWEIRCTAFTGTHEVLGLPAVKLKLETKKNEKKENGQKIEMITMEKVEKLLIYVIKNQFHSKKQNKNTKNI